MSDFSRFRHRFFAGVVLAAVAGLTVVPTSASASSVGSLADQQCRSEAISVASTQVARENGIDAAASFDFVCIADRVQVWSGQGAGSVVKTENAQGQAVVMSEADFASKPAEAPAAARGVTPRAQHEEGPDLVRDIYDPYSSNAAAIIRYGRNGGGSDTWARSVTTNLTLGLKTTTVDVKWKWSTDQFQGITLESIVALQQMQGIFPPTQIDYWVDTKPPVSNPYQSTGGIEGWMNRTNTVGQVVSGTFSVHVYQMELQDREKGFSRKIDNEVASFRFLCASATSQCTYPDGKEAGVFG